VNCGGCWVGWTISRLNKLGYAQVDGVLGTWLCTTGRAEGPRKWGLTRIFCLGGTMPTGGMSLPALPAMLPRPNPNGARLPMRGRNGTRCGMVGNLGRPKPITLGDGRICSNGRGAECGIRRRPLCCWFCINMSIFCWSSWLTSETTKQGVCNKRIHNMPTRLNPKCLQVLSPMTTYNREQDLLLQRTYHLFHHNAYSQRDGQAE